jgi:hypothetical protein
MDWMPIFLEIVVQALIELGPFVCSAMEQSAARTKHQAMAQPDHWKCPSEAQFAEFLRHSGARRSAGPTHRESLPGIAECRRESDSSATDETGAGFLSRGASHPLWDRELDA